MIEGNKIIRASAGTGKTYALATRFIRLMALDGVAPERIVALTFSRAAAQEIYMAILKRLWEAAASDEGAEREKTALLSGLGEQARAESASRRIDWSKENFARMLRKVTDTQHSGAIATLDSFIVRLVKNFPPENGIAAAVLDEQGEAEAMETATRKLLGGDGKGTGIMEAFRAAKEGLLPRTCAEALEKILKDEGWSALMLDNPVCREWTAETMAAALGLPSQDDIKAALDEMCKVSQSVTDKTAKKWLEALTGKLMKVTPGEAPFTGEKNTAMEFAAALAEHPDKPYVVHVKSSGEEETREFPPEVFKAAYRALCTLNNAYLRRRLRLAAAKIKLAAIVDAQYDALTRRQGRLTFRDFTNAANDPMCGNADLQEVQFRFDSRLDHWELDEFQDTSEVQWACLKPLVETAASGEGGRTVMAVGDLKQSIYTWRGGNDRPFEEVAGWFARGAGESENLDVSHRYGENIAGFVNAVFGRRNLKDDAPAELKGSAAAEIWLERCWMEHKAKGKDYVKVSRATATDAQKPEEAVMEELGRELEDMWREHEAQGSEEEIGVLVRRNKEGAKVAEFLRQRGLPVVWEGMNRIDDLPAVQAVMNVLRLAEHPEDGFAWKFVHELTPTTEILFGAAADAGEVSRKTSEKLSHLGLSRTLRDFCGMLCRDENGLDGLSKERLRTLVKLGVNYECRKAADYGVDGFARYVSGAKSREGAGGTIRILTVHRSKGLTLDRVLVPIFDTGRESICEVGVRDALRGADWMMPHISRNSAMLNDATKLAYARQGQMRLLDALRTYYVAFTRSRNALYVIMPPATDGRFSVSDLVSNAVKADPVFEAGQSPEWRKMKRDKAADGGAKWKFEKRAERIEKIAPSKLKLPGGGKRSAAALFGEDYGAAAKRGVEKHAELAAIEWAEGAELAAMDEALQEAFRKPEEGAKVWRERSYELFDGKHWETGQFDRVVFTGEGAQRRAIIYDFKTGSNPDAERQYAPQLEQYRRALSRITGIALGRITAKSVVLGPVSSR